MEDNNPKALCGELLSYSKSHVWSIYYHPVVGSSVNSPVKGHVFTFYLLSFPFGSRKSPFGPTQPSNISKELQPDINSRFYFISFAIIFINPFCFFLFWNRQDKDAQLASFAKKRCFIIQIQQFVYLKNKYKALFY